MLSPYSDAPENVAVLLIDLQARLDMRGMGRILRHIHYHMGRYIQFHVTPKANFAPPWRTHSLFLSWLRVSTDKERPSGHDCDLKASLAIFDGAHESVG